VPGHFRGARLGLNQPLLESDYRFKINRAVWEAPACFTIALADQSVFNQKVWADQQCISRKRRQA